MRESDIGVQFSTRLMRGLDLLRQNGYLDQFEALWDAIRHDAVAGVRTLLDSGSPSPGLVELAALSQTEYSPEGTALDRTFAALFGEELREKAKQHLQRVGATPASDLALGRVDDTADLPEADAFFIRYDRAFRLLEKYNLGTDVENPSCVTRQKSAECLFLAAYIGRCLSLKFTTPDLLELFDTEMPLLHFSLLAAEVSAAPELFPLGEPIITGADLETETIPWLADPGRAFEERLSNVVDVVKLRSTLWELAHLRAQTETLAELKKRVDELGEAVRQRTAQAAVDVNECESALVNSLGEALFYSLVSAARQHLVAAEYLSRVPGLPNPGLVLLEIAFAFEKQAEDLVFACQQGGGRGLGLAELTAALSNRSHWLHVCLREKGIDARALAGANEQIRKIRNAIAHGAAFGPEQVRQLQRDWLERNPRRKGIFSGFVRGSDPAAL